MVRRISSSSSNALAWTRSTAYTPTRPSLTTSGMAIWLCASGRPGSDAASWSLSAWPAASMRARTADRYESWVWMFPMRIMRRFLATTPMTPWPTLTSAPIPALSYPRLAASVSSSPAGSARRIMQCLNPSTASMESRMMSRSLPRSRVELISEEICRMMLTSLVLRSISAFRPSITFWRRASRSGADSPFSSWAAIMSFRPVPHASRNA